MFKRSIILIVVITFFVSLMAPYSRTWAADPILDLPIPGTMVNLSPAYEPVLIKGLKIHPDNPLSLDFIVDTGDKLLVGDPQLRQESNKLIKYFFAALTLPEKDVWVNLSPYEKNRIVPDATGQTEMGRDMLAQDYILKQLTASLMYPEKGLGKDFWNRIYSEAQERFGSTEIPVNTFNKVWIVADKASVYEAKDTVLVVDAHLKVMLEEDYLAMSKHQIQGTHSTASNIIRQIILPALEKEVNEGRNFANLRQIFHSIILAKWYKESLKTALLNQVYSNKNKITGLSYKNISSDTMSSPNVSVGDPSYIYQQYLKAYKKGVFNYIKEDVDQVTKQSMPRKYFSGGVTEAAMIVTRATVSDLIRTHAAIPAGRFVDEAMTANPTSAATSLLPEDKDRQMAIIRKGLEEALKESNHARPDALGRLHVPFAVPAVGGVQEREFIRQFQEKLANEVAQKLQEQTGFDVRVQTKTDRVQGVVGYDLIVESSVANPQKPALNDIKTKIDLILNDPAMLTEIIQSLVTNFYGLFQSNPTDSSIFVRLLVAAVVMWLSANILANRWPAFLGRNAKKQIFPESISLPSGSIEIWENQFINVESDSAWKTPNTLKVVKKGVIAEIFKLSPDQETLEKDLISLDEYLMEKVTSSPKEHQTLLLQLKTPEQSYLQRLVNILSNKADFEDFFSDKDIIGKSFVRSVIARCAPHNIVLVELEGRPQQPVADTAMIADLRKDNKKVLEDRAKEIFRAIVNLWRSKDDEAYKAFESLAIILNDPDFKEKMSEKGNVWGVLQANQYGKLFFDEKGEVSDAVREIIRSSFNYTYNGIDIHDPLKNGAAYYLDSDLLKNKMTVEALDRSLTDYLQQLSRDPSKSKLLEKTYRLLFYSVLGERELLDLTVKLNKNKAFLTLLVGRSIMSGNFKLLTAELENDDQWKTALLSINEIIGRFTTAKEVKVEVLDQVDGHDFGHDGSAGVGDKTRNKVLILGGQRFDAFAVTTALLAIEKNLTAGIEERDWREKKKFLPLLAVSSKNSNLGRFLIANLITYLAGRSGQIALGEEPSDNDFKIFGIILEAKGKQKVSNRNINAWATFLILDKIYPPVNGTKENPTLINLDIPSTLADGQSSNLLPLIDGRLGGKTKSYVLKTPGYSDIQILAYKDPDNENNIRVSLGGEENISLSEVNKAWIVPQGEDWKIVLSQPYGPSLKMEFNLKSPENYWQAIINNTMGKTVSLSDAAMDSSIANLPASVNPNGGIDLNASKFNLQKIGSGVNIKFNQAMIARFQQGNFTGIVPVITKITPIADIYPMLGLK